MGQAHCLLVLSLNAPWCFIAFPYWRAFSPQLRIGGVRDAHATQLTGTREAARIEWLTRYVSGIWVEPKSSGIRKGTVTDRIQSSYLHEQLAADQSRQQIMYGAFDAVQMPSSTSAEVAYETDK